MMAGENGLAYKVGIGKGDELASINGVHPIPTDEISEPLRISV